MSEHNFTKGAELNTGGLERLKEQFAHQRMSADKMLEKLKSDRERQIDIISDTRTLQMVPVPQEWQDAIPEVDQVEREVPLKAQVAIIPRDIDAEEWYQTAGPIIPNSHAHSQLATNLGIPQAYYRKMLAETPDLLAVNVNEWMDREASRRMVRLQKLNNGTHASVGRAYLSDRYRRLDIAELAERFVPMLNDQARGWQIRQCGLTSLRMHIEAVMPHLNGAVRVGDEVALAVKVTSSDVGAGALAVSLGFYRVVCSNLAIMPSYSQRQVHLGGAQDDFVQLLSETTLKKEDELIMDKMRDVVDTMADRGKFEEMLNLLRDSNDAKLLAPVAATTMFGKMVGLQQTELETVKNEMMESGMPSIWGLTNALTATARNLDMERKLELETAAGKILETPTAWKQLINAA